MNVEIKKSENLSPKKLNNFGFFSKNLPPTTYHLQPNRGFTLVELLVTLSLFVILTTIVLFNQSKFNGSILLTNLAYDVALTVRQAQTYGVNVREDVKESQADEKFKHAYGVHFDTSKDKQFLMFADANGSKQYNGSWQCKENNDECVNSYSIKRGNKISDIKITSTNSGCSTGCSVNQLDISFLRPDPDATFSSPGKSNITEAKIIISSADGSNSRNVLVNSTGQISIGRGM